MKIDINKIKLVPDQYGFNFCQFGNLSKDVEDWSEYWNFKMEKSGPYTNILINDDTDISLLFNEPKVYEYIDGFSPNLNKHLHVGHLSNLVIANAMQKLGIGKKSIAILGDTVTGEISKQDALQSFRKYCTEFGYKVDNIFFASDMSLKNNILVDGEDKYLGTKIFDLGDEKVVGIKSSGETSYFYQDIALAEYLDSPTLYLTGLEQKNHFNMVKKLYPNIDHIGLGLVLLDSKKMSSSEGNIIYLSDFINDLIKIFDNIELVYNVLAGQILKSNLSVNKLIDKNLIKNPKTSLGLYMSYTMAHIKSCGVYTKLIKNYNSKELTFAEIKSKVNLSPNVLFEALVKHCKIINKLYEKHYIKNNKENIEMFSGLISDLDLGMKKLGMFSINKV